MSVEEGKCQGNNHGRRMCVALPWASRFPLSLGRGLGAQNISDEGSSDRVVDGWLTSAYTQSLHPIL